MEGLCDCVGCDKCRRRKANIMTIEQYDDEFVERTGDTVTKLEYTEGLG